MERSSRERGGARDAVMMARLSRRQIADFRKAVHAYYRAHGRHDLAWRNTRDPYRILVSELMLQQTQVPRVAAKYDSFVERFPDFGSLARAPLREVLTEWSGLGYNRRALQLGEIARCVVSRYDGALPREYDRLRELPGIGPATAAEIMNFAFGVPCPFIETNVRAVFIHHFFPGRGKVSDAEILPLVELTLDRADSREWFYALMDYGGALKARHANPSRRSAHHTKQSAFAGSSREARGLIVKALTGRLMSEAELARKTGLRLARVRAVIPALTREGLVMRRGKKLGIA